MDFGELLGGSKSKENRMKNRISKILERNDFSKVFEGIETNSKDKEAGQALKIILTERAVRYATKALKIAKRKKIRLGPSAIIIAADNQE